MKTLGNDLRYALRMLRNSPGFTAVAVLSLALGIGACTTIFSVLNTILLRPLPLKDPDRLVVVFETDRERGRERPLTFSDFFELKKQNRVFEDIGLNSHYSERRTLSGVGAAEQVRFGSVGPKLFSVLGVPPILGRTILAEDIPSGDPGESTTVVISHGFWQRYFDADPNVLGQTVAIDGWPKTVIGVMPAGFWIFPWQKDFDVLLAYHVRSYPPSTRWMYPIARLKPGVTIEQAQAEMDIIAQRLKQAQPKADTAWEMKVENLHGWALGGYQDNLYLLLGAVSFVLLIACTNVANLLLARANTRGKEIAVRASLGAGRFRLVRQLLSESVLLALLGGSLGVLLALWGIDIFAALAPEWFARAEEITIDVTVLGFTLGVSVLTGILFGLAPAFQSSKPDLNESLKEGGRHSTGGTGQRGRNLLVVSEVALALILLIGAGLMINSLLRLQRVDPGFRAENVLTAETFLAEKKYWDYAEGNSKRVTPQVATFYEQVLEGIEGLPGVESAGMISYLSGGRSSPFTIAGRLAPPPRERPKARFSEVSPNFFQVMKIPLLRGRYLSDRDVEEAPWVVLINETMARRFFPNEDPIGKVLRLTIQAGSSDVEEDRSREIVGVVGDVRHWGPRNDPPLAMYSSYRQHPWEFPGGGYSVHARKHLVIRTATDPMSLVGAVRRTVAGVDKDQAVFDFMTMEQRLAEWLIPQRFYMRLFGIFAGLALLLAVVGIYGVMSYSVSRRTHEIGVRLALGARRTDIMKLVVRQGLKLTLLGVAIGIAVSLALTRLISQFLYGVKPTDPVTFVTVSLVLTAVALAACYIPARRATKVDPIVALRHE